jgi:hypothetical protein
VKIAPPFVISALTLTAPIVVPPARKPSSPGFTCPQCGTVNSLDDPSLGYCPRCKAFTGMCAVGWQVVCAGEHHGGGPHAATWHAPCGERGMISRRLRLPGGTRMELRLCARHDAALQATGAPGEFAPMAKGE